MKIDALLQPILADDELRRRIGKPWGSGRLPELLGTRYQPPFDEIVAPTEQTTDPAAVAELVFERQGLDAAVLTPLTRGLLPNPQQAAAIARATNEWLAEEWLSYPTAQGRFNGSIRAVSTDVPSALDEIERWAADPRFVQIAIQTRAYLPFGDEYYFPIWQAAARHGLPVCIVDDHSTVVEHHETPVGAPRYFAEKHALRPLASIVHISSLITCGVFERLPDLRFIVGDGSVDVARPMMWRVDRDWRQGRVEIPWVERLPSLYLEDHFRFVSQPEDGAPDGFHVEQQSIDVTDAERLLIFGSHYPYWACMDPADAFDGWASEARDAIFGRNLLGVTPRLESNLAAAG